MSPNPRPPLFVSIIIPVFNDSAPLRLCLTALAEQTYDKSAYEVIVVDNNSEEDLSLVTADFDQVKLVSEPTPGSYIARNKGISHAVGEIIAFTDADCIPEPDWIEKGVSVLTANPDAGMVAGRIELFFQMPNQPGPFELYDKLTMGFPQKKFIENAKFGATANVFTYRKVLDDVGYFDESLKSGGDREWGRRVYDKGYPQIYADDVCIRHPARHSWADVKKRSIRISGGKYDLAKRQWTSQWDGIKDLLLFMKPPFGIFFRIWKDDRLKTTQEKMQFTMVMLRIRYVSIKERLRLQLGGGASERS